MPRINKEQFKEIYEVILDTKKDMYDEVVVIIDFLIAEMELLRDEIDSASDDISQIKDNFIEEYEEGEFDLDIDDLYENGLNEFMNKKHWDKIERVYKSHVSLWKVAEEVVFSPKEFARIQEARQDLKDLFTNEEGEE